MTARSSIFTVPAVERRLRLVVFCSMEMRRQAVDLVDVRHLVRSGPMGRAAGATSQTNALAGAMRS